ncbi:unnamed protein product [Heligmosomoides polygyrus]|uniref:Uncharacterized protein n=1 Tax=Heligmosomoides polygyrus TaxID=6339 RepID=A0A183FY52_HELPZ|nr:unnamed protein product [Heligmosomoides polygyrus]
MEGLVALGGKSKPGTWYLVHATVGASSDCATRAPGEEGTSLLAVGDSFALADRKKCKSILDGKKTTIG